MTQTQPVEHLIAKFIANRVGRDYEHIDVMLALSLLDYLKEEGWEVTEIVPPRPGDHRLCTTTGHTAPGRCENCGAVFEEAPEVEVTYDRSPLPVEVPETLLERRRSGAKNVSAPEYQNAFISEARASMGQPSRQDAEALLGYTVTLSFNVDWPPVTGVLTDVTGHPAGAPQLILDNYRERVYPLNAIQQIVKVR